VHTVKVRTEFLETAVASWHLPPAIDSLRGMRLLFDAHVPALPSLAVTRSVLRSNPQLAPAEALELATAAVSLARSQGLDYGFFAATLLQESAFDPRALSPAGAVGIAQFTLDTADAYGVNPFDPVDAMRGSARLLGDYYRDYAGRYPDPYAATLAAYNAGPGAVEQYHGVPPYPETKEYVGLVYERWSRIVRDATGAGAPRP
jgi:soluble lytic murein transglycosylase-like protein